MNLDNLFREFKRMENRYSQSQFNLENKMFNVLDMKETPIPDTKSVVYHGFRINVPTWTKYIVSDTNGDLIAIGSFMDGEKEIPPYYDDEYNLWDSGADSEILPYKISFTGNIKESLTQVV